MRLYNQAMAVSTTSRVTSDDIIARAFRNRTLTKECFGTWKTNWETEKERLRR